jgi:hypothetical protein
MYHGGCLIESGNGSDFLRVKQPVISNPEMLYKKYWENP